jgi:DNA-binding HxlR family transcriptional regulator
MVTNTPSRRQHEFALAVLAKVSGTWSLQVLRVLSEAETPLRFTRLREQVAGISQKVLTSTLRALERDGLVRRTLYPQVPPRVEYQISTLGQEMLLQILPAWQWIAARREIFEAARERFGAAQKLG